MKEIGIIKNLKEFIDIIIRVYTNWNYSKHLFFRGHSNEKYKLLPSVFRNQSYIEKDIYLDFMQYAPENNIHFDFIRESDKVLADMQHYGIPTRLLDWTINPLVALFFSCISNNKEENGRVYLFDPWGYNSKISDYSIPKNHETNIYARSLLVYGWDKRVINEHVKEKFFIECTNSLEKPFSYVSQFTNKRKVNQRGCFLIYGNDKTPFDEIKEVSSFLDFFTIDKNFKEQILNELNMFYVNEYSIYPDYYGMKKMITRYGGLFNL